MRNDLTPAFLIEMDKDSNSPIQLLVFHFPVIGDIFLSDRDIVIDGQLYEGLVENWGDKTTVGAENAISSTETLTITLWNGGDNPFSSLFFNEDPINVFVSLYQTYDGLLPEDIVVIGEFVIQDPVEYSEASNLLDLELRSTNMRYFANVGKLLTRNEFPDALEAHLNSPIDFIVGEAGSVRCLCSKKPKVATVNGSFLKNPAKVYVHEDLTGWPLSGHIQIDDELMRYSSRGEGYFVVDQRGAYATKVSEHSDGSEIIQGLIKPEYIAGIAPLGSIFDVLVKGQVPTVPYTVDAVLGKIVFDAAPTYIEFSKGARKVEENFDSHEGSTCFNPAGAYDTDLMSDGAVLSNSGLLLQLQQETPARDDGEVVKVFLAIDHWATKLYLHDYVTVAVEGVSKIWTLNRANNKDQLTGETLIDIRHEHGHQLGGLHEHDSIDSVVSLADPTHPHGVDAVIPVKISSINYDTGFDFADTGGNSCLYHSDRTFSFNTAEVPKASYTESCKFTYNVESDNDDGWVDYIDVWMQRWTGSAWTTMKAIRVDTPGKAGTIELPVNYNYDSPWTTGFARRIIMKARLCLPTGVDWIGITYNNAIWDFNSKLNTTKSASANIDSTQTSGNVTGVSDGVEIKSPDDVDPLTDTPQFSEIEIRENATQSTTQRFDVTEQLQYVDWEWLQGRNVSLTHVDTGNGENPEIVVTYIRFEVEYRQRQVKTTDEITCNVVGSIESRPDAVIQHLLHNVAGVPLENFGSVWRDFNYWDDTEIWEDTEIWQDGGQVTNVPDGAYFEEAAAWFAYPDRNFTIDGVIKGNISVKEAVEMITWQSRSRLLWQNGKVQLVIKRKSENWQIVKELDLNDIQLKSFKAKRSRVDQIQNSIDIFHSIDRLSTAVGSEQYNRSFDIKDMVSIEKHGTKKDDSKWLFDLVRSDSMAESLADYYIWELGETSTFYQFDAYLNQFNLEKDDYIKISSFRFDRLKGVQSIIRECVRRFGSGKLGKINTLQMIAQVIRHKAFLVNINDIVSVSDTLLVDFGFDLSTDDFVLAQDQLLFNLAREKVDSVGVSDVFEILANYNSTFNSEVLSTDSLSFAIEMNLENNVNVTDSLNIQDSAGFGGGGFGEIPFGSPTEHGIADTDVSTIQDILSFHWDKLIEDSVEVTDSLGMSDGFGNPTTLSDGFGNTPFGDPI